MLADRKPRSWFHERRPCPLCEGATVYRGHPCGHCHGVGSLPPILPPRPTVLTMDGETTSTGDTRAADVLDDPPEFLDAWVCSWSCPAPTPRAKP